MTERDAFEIRFHAAVRDYAARVSSDLDPVALASEIVAATPRWRRGPIPGVRGRSLGTPVLAWAPLLLACLLLAIAGAALVGALVTRERPQTVLPATLPWPSEPDRWVLDPVPPLHATAIAAVSAGEAWATDGEALWHFVDGAWAGPTSEGLPARPASAEPTDPRIKAIAVAPDGTLWGALDAGPAAFRDGTWRLAVADHPTVAWKPLAIASDGTVWWGTGTGNLTGYVYRIDARTGEATQFWCGFPSAITVAGDGTLYIFGTQWGIGHQLWAIRDGRCEQVDLPGASGWVHYLATDPAGGVVGFISSRDAGDPDLAVGPDWRLARFDGRRWTVLETPSPGDGAPNPSAAVVDPAGGIWSLWSLGPDMTLRRFDGRRSVEIDAPVNPFSTLSIAPDGVLWLTGLEGVTRLRPEWATSPASKP